MLRFIRKKERRSFGNEAPPKLVTDGTDSDYSDIAKLSQRSKSFSCEDVFLVGSNIRRPNTSSSHTSCSMSTDSYTFSNTSSSGISTDQISYTSSASIDNHDHEHKTNPLSSSGLGTLMRRFKNDTKVNLLFKLL